MISRICRCAFALVFVFAASVFAQETRGTIIGHVLDEQGGAMPGVTVTITNVDTNVSATLTTNSTGYYQAPLLLPGNYRVSAELQGFKTSVRSGIILSVAQQATRRPDAGRRRGERDRHRQRRGPDTRDRRPHHRAEPRSAQRREPADVLEHAGAADAVRHRRQLVGQRAVCGAGVRQPHVERHVCARRRGRKRMDDRRRDQQRQRSAPRLVAELRHDRGSAHRDGELRRVVRTWHGPRHLDDDARRHQHDARDRELSVLEQPVERAAIFREAELLRQHRAGGSERQHGAGRVAERRRTSTPTGNRTTSRPRSAARSSGTSSSRS